MIKNQFIIPFILSSLCVAAACSPKVQNRGYVKQNNWKEAIIVGQTNKEDVINRFGSPSTKSNFGKETWYYVSSRKEGIAFMRPKVAEQETVNIHFDASGVVSGMEIYDKNKAKDIALVKRVTPTEGHSLNFIDQTLGNLGRFNRPNRNSSIAPSTRPTN